MPLHTIRGINSGLLSLLEAAGRKCFWEKVFRMYAGNLQENIHADVWFLNKVALQIYWNCTSAWVFSCKFAADLQSTFS